MSRVKAGEPAKTGHERAGPRTSVETEPWTEATADLTNVVMRGAGMAAIGLVIVQIVAVAQTLVLGRLLGPLEVGVFTAGSVMTGVMFLFSQGTLFQALPYVLTLVAVAGVIGRSTPPAADGRPYVKQ